MQRNHSLEDVAERKNRLICTVSGGSSPEQGGDMALLLAAWQLILDLLSGPCVYDGHGPDTRVGFYM